MKTRAEALAKGMTIDDSACGRPWAYKGARFNPTEAFEIHTDLEVELMEQVQNLTQEVMRLEHELDHAYQSNPEEQP